VALIQEISWLREFSESKEGSKEKQLTNHILESLDVDERGVMADVKGNGKNERSDKSSWEDDNT
jgi:hypothetical protein